jgi:hypothetical protein
MRHDKQTGGSQFLHLFDTRVAPSNKIVVYASKQTAALVTTVGLMAWYSLKVSQSARSRSAPSARMHALKRTRRLLQSDTVEYRRALPRTILIEDSVVLVHGGARDVHST